MPKGYSAATGLPTNPEGRKRMNYLQHYSVADNGCWVWKGTTVGVKGYGYIRFPEGAKMVHRYFYEHHVGPVPDGLVLDHLCRNRRCVNPAHLEPVTSRENTLRGDSTKETCLNGHPFDTVWNAAGKPFPTRACKRCGAARSKARRARERAARHAS